MTAELTIPEEITAPEDPTGIRAKAAQLERFKVMGSDHRLLWRPNNLTPVWLSAEQKEVLRAESVLIVDSAKGATSWPEYMRRDVGLGIAPCPYCNGNKWQWVDAYGQDTGVRVQTDTPCPCIMLLRFYPRWEENRPIGKDYDDVTLKHLDRFQANFGTFVRTGRFNQLFETVKQYRHNCFLLAGPHGQGKTTLLMALYRQALTEWAYVSYHKGVSHPAVWIANATKLSEEYRAWEMRDEGPEDGPLTKYPSIMDSKIEAAARAGLKPCIFIEEIDKFKLDSDFQRKKFSRIIDATHQAGGQIVATSNLSHVDLCKRLGEQYGGGIVRRIIGARGNRGVDPIKNEDGTLTYPLPDQTPGGFYIDFWKATIKQNIDIVEVLQTGASFTGYTKESPKTAPSYANRTPHNSH